MPLVLLAAGEMSTGIALASFVVILLMLDTRMRGWRVRHPVLSPEEYAQIHREWSPYN